MIAYIAEQPNGPEFLDAMAKLATAASKFVVEFTRKLEVRYEYKYISHLRSFTVGRPFPGSS